MRAGLLDPPGSTPYDTLNASNVYTPQMQQLALDAALAAVVLLKNSNNALPVTVDSLVVSTVVAFSRWQAVRTCERSPIRTLSRAPVVWIGTCM